MESPVGPLQELVRTGRRILGLTGESVLCFSRDTLTVVDNLSLIAEMMGSFTSIAEAMQRYVEDHINKSVERWKIGSQYFHIV